jgi:hypothetical protein
MRCVAIEPGERFGDVVDCCARWRAERPCPAPSAQRALIERHPVRFWQVLCLLLLVALVISLVRR